MNRAFAVIALVLATGCAKARPPLAPNLRSFQEVPREPDDFTEPESEMNQDIPPFDPLHGAGIADQIKARFRGHDRLEPKTGTVMGSVKKFGDVAALANSLPSDDDMRHHTPPITTTTSERMTEEIQNVRVKAWIYAITYESDQDWHVILGTDPSSASRTFFNAEVSGLPGPSAADFSTLRDVRQALADILANDLPSSNKYRVYDHPLPVVVEGPLFFDVDHAAGVVGPSKPTVMRPQTAWEIHPITKLMLQ